MNLQIKNKLFIVCGATSGFGQSVANQLLDEGANVIVIARGEEKLKEQYDSVANAELLTADISKSETIKRLVDIIGNRELDGILVNSAGPPAKSFVETNLNDWDEAYQNILRWKVEITQAFLSKFTTQMYGRMVFIESAAVKQPLENLVLSTSMRLSVVGFVKTLSQEMPDKNVTFNILAPGYHYTPAVERLIKKKCENENISFEKAKEILENNLPMKKTGDVDKFASLALWLLSPLSEYVTGQVFAVDGGVIKSTL